MASELVLDAFCVTVLSNLHLVKFWRTHGEDGSAQTRFNNLKVHLNSSEK